MAQNTDGMQKIYVNNGGAAAIKCPACNLVKNFDVKKFKGSKHIQKVKCRCQNIFQVRFEFREFYRKPTRLTGEYVQLPERTNRGGLMVTNVSRGGVGLKIMGAHRLKPGSELQVSFALDDSHASQINKQVVVRLVANSTVCCQFKGNPAQDQALGFYLMA